MGEAEWVYFVVRNRSERSFMHGCDVVIGPTADDDTRLTIQQYLLEAFGDVGSDDAIEGFLRRIKAENLSTQWLFASRRAASLLQFKDRRVIR